ncbi:MAG: hypothetical protein WKF94_02380 [Solirubrobacteraceae bacterium]
MAPRLTEHDVVRFLSDSGGWPAGTVGTVVQSSDMIALVEIADDCGRALGFVSISHEQLTTERKRPPAQRH